jgi:probable HAF family extracellular repeat protein
MLALLTPVDRLPDSPPSPTPSVRSYGTTACLRILGTLPGATESRAFGINNRGQITGVSTGPELFGRAFLCDRGMMIDLGTLPGDVYSEGTSINDRGQVVGVSSGEVFGRAFLWSNGEMIDLGTLGGTFSGASAINNRGQVTGWADTLSGEIHAFLWEDGIVTAIGAMPGSTLTYARGINNQGQIVGSASFPSFEFHGFLWEDGVFVDLGPSSQASAINDRGQIVGFTERAFSVGERRHDRSRPA